MLAEHWVGAAKGYDNAMILTLGTGLGTGIIANGELVRAGRGLHPEGGHIILNPRTTRPRPAAAAISAAPKLISRAAASRAASAPASRTPNLMAEGHRRARAKAAIRARSPPSRSTPQIMAVAHP